MNYFKLFKDAWKLIWSNKLIWIFSFIAGLTTLIDIIEQYNDLLFWIYFFLLLLEGISILGIIVIALYLALENTLSIKSISRDIKSVLPSFMLLIGTLVILFGIIQIIPLFGLGFAFSISPLTIMFGFLWIGLDTLFSAILIFSILGILTYHISVPRSMNRSIRIISRNILPIIIIEVVFYLSFQLFALVSGFVILLTQSGLSVNALATLTFQTYLPYKNDPTMASFLFLYELIITPLNLAVYTQAYLQFAKKPKADIP